MASSHLVGDVKGRTCVICDDMTSTTGTLCAAAELLKKEGAGKVSIYSGSHPDAAGHAYMANKIYNATLNLF